jgi:RNA polymerase sigma-70 factor (ECF subfamily)
VLVSAEETERLFQTLVDSYAQSVGLFLAQLVRDRSAAEDLLQETLLAAYRNRAELRAVENPQAWLFAIARNRALDAGRSRQRRGRLLRRLAWARLERDPDPADAVAVRDLLARHLDPHERALLILRYLHGFDAAELALVVGTSPEAIRQRLSRIRRRLQPRLEAEARAALPSPRELRPRGPDVHRIQTGGGAEEDDALRRLLVPLAAVRPLEVNPIAVGE